MNKNMNSLHLIQEMSEARGISGFEEEVVGIAECYAAGFANVSRDSLLNCYIRRQASTSSVPVVMIDGHSDEIGFMVQSITASGMLNIVPVGGWIAHNVPAHEFHVRTRQGTYVRGITSSKPPHFMSDEERKKSIRLEDILIDVCAISKDDAENRVGISVGAPAVPIAAFEYHEESEFMIGKAFDNRLGCCCTLEIMRVLANEDLQVEPVGVLSSQEEIGLRGASVSAVTVKPEVAIVFEGTPADDSWEGANNIQGGVGKGPQIRFWDRSMVANPRFVEVALQAAQEHGVEIQKAVRSGGGTDGGAIHLSNAGIPTIVIGIPVRYAHSHYGVSSFADYNAAIQWGVHIIKSLNADIISAL